MATSSGYIIPIKVNNAIYRRETHFSMKTAEATAYKSIMDMILSRSFAPGDRLVETEIAEKLHMSRTPIRNVMRMFIAEGLLETKGSKGCYIPQLTPEDMAAVFKARAFLEGKAALEATYSRTNQDIKRLQDLLESEKQKYREGALEEYAEINREFHLLIAEISHNEYIEKFTRQVFWRSGLYIFYFDRFYAPLKPTELLRDPSKSVSCNQHEQIVNAIIAGDGNAAENFMHAHIDTTYAKMAGRLPKGSEVFGIQNKFM